MFKNFRDKIVSSGITVLCIGVALLIVTFVSACVFLTADLSPNSTQDLVQAFGAALGPLIAAAVRIMYLGVMGWIGSLVTIRGVTLMTKAEATAPTAQAPQVPVQKAQPQPETRPAEPELIVIPLEQMEHQQPPQPRRKQSK